MKLFIWIISSISLLFALRPLLEFGQPNINSSTDLSVDMNLVEVRNIDTSSLELKWDKEYQQINAKTQDSNEAVQVMNDILDDASKVQFDGNTFELLGIFKVSGKPFILVRSSTKGLIKLSDNEQLTERVYIKHISSDSVLLFEKDHEVAKLKLFKWQKNDEAVE
ncbi:hypothetical protein [Pseudoalteromonas xiamenensis]